MAARPIVIIDTSVFLQDALSAEQKGAASQLLAIVPSIAHVVMCLDAYDELVEKLEALDWTMDDIRARYGLIFDQAIWVEPVVEQPHHLKAAGQDLDDTIFVRAAEAVFEQAADIIGEQQRFIVSSNTKHFPPGADYAGFRFDTPHGVLKALE